MDDVHSSNVVEWIFPDFKDTAFTDCNEDEKSEIEIKLRKMQDEVDELKLEYQSKLQVVNSIIEKCKQPLLEIDADLIDLVNFLINKTVRKIIHKEIQSDPKIIKKIIKELCDLMQNKNGVMTVFVSEKDFNKMHGEDLELIPSIFIKSSDKLNEGDVIVKSNFCEIRAILNERINKLIGIKNG